MSRASCWRRIGLRWWQLGVGAEAAASRLRGAGGTGEHVDDVVGEVWNDCVVSAPGIARRREPLPHSAVYALALPRTRKPAPTNVRYTRRPSLGREVPPRATYRACRCPCTCGSEQPCIPARVRICPPSSGRHVDGLSPSLTPVRPSQHFHRAEVESCSAIWSPSVDATRTNVGRSRSTRSSNGNADWHTTARRRDSRSSSSSGARHFARFV